MVLAERVRQLLADLDKYPIRDVHVFTRYDRAVDITIPWSDAAAVRDRITALDLVVSNENRYALNVTETLECRVRVNVTIPVLELAQHVAVAAVTVNQREPERLPAAATDPIGSGVIGFLIAEETTRGPLGRTSPGQHTLATLLMGNADIADKDIGTIDVAAVLDALSLALIRTPELLVVADALDKPAPKTPLEPAPVAALEPTPRHIPVPAGNPDDPGVRAVGADRY
jgi:hypothetical protein